MKPSARYAAISILPSEKQPSTVVRNEIEQEDAMFEDTARSLSLVLWMRFCSLEKFSTTLFGVHGPYAWTTDDISIDSILVNHGMLSSEAPLFVQDGIQELS